MPPRCCAVVVPRRLAAPPLLLTAVLATFVPPAFLASPLGSRAKGVPSVEMASTQASTRLFAWLNPSEV